MLSQSRLECGECGGRDGYLTPRSSVLSARPSSTGSAAAAAAASSRVRSRSFVSPPSTARVCVTAAYQTAESELALAASCVTPAAAAAAPLGQRSELQKIMS